MTNFPFVLIVIVHDLFKDLMTWLYIYIYIFKTCLNTLDNYLIQVNDHLMGLRLDRIKFKKCLNNDRTIL